ncbi:MAG: hypothetical protein HYY91_05650 [Candidatus Omnitrophica bacterium]|nr:hypothetical protein [Candidatus Omnitrophota bacterium]
MDPSAERPEPITYHYTFTFPSSGDVKYVRIRLDGTTLTLIPEPKPSPPWTALDHHQCPNCPLKKEQDPCCPAAVSLVDIVEFFSRSFSYETVEVCIESGERRYVKQTSLQQALSSLIGLLMVTSGCPVMGKLKPMVRHHLPFSTFEETRYRVLSMYLLAQYFVARRGRQPDWTFAQLASLYEEIGTVNASFHQRFLELAKGDASLNALAILQMFGETIKLSLDEKLLDDLEVLFQSYLEGR